MLQSPGDQGRRHQCCQQAHEVDPQGGRPTLHPHAPDVLMGITQGMEPAGRAPAVLGSPFPGILGLCVPGRGHGGTPGHRETAPGGLSNLGVRDGVHREREGDERTLSQLQAVSQLWGCSSSAVPSFIPCCGGSWSGAAGTPGYWRGAELLGSAPCAWHLPSLTSCGCANSRRDVAALRGPLCCCARRWRVTPSRQGTGLA